MVRLQMVLNATAGLVVGLGKYEHIMPDLRDVLHWLVLQRIQSKIAALAVDSVRDTGPAYFSHVILAVVDISGRSGLRSAVRGNLFVRQTIAINQAWPTELFYCCSSRLELTSTTSPLFVRKSPTVSSWAQDSSLQGSLH